VNIYTVGGSIALSWIIPIIASALAASKSFENNEMCIPSHSETKIGTLLGKMIKLIETLRRQSGYVGNVPLFRIKGQQFESLRGRRFYLFLSRNQTSI
jgi:hypothetical protein